MLDQQNYRVWKFQKNPPLQTQFTHYINFGTTTSSFLFCPNSKIKLFTNKNSCYLSKPEPRVHKQNK